MLFDMQIFGGDGFYVYVFTSFVERIRGVIGREWLLRDGVCVLLNCHCVHTFFVRQSFYVYFISSDYRVLFRAFLAPYRLSRLVLGAWCVIESLRPLSDQEISHILSGLS